MRGSSTYPNQIEAACFLLNLMGKKPKEIATSLICSEGYVKASICKCRQKLMRAGVSFQKREVHPPKMGFDAMKKELKSDKLSKFEELKQLSREAGLTK